jgi:putative drug exporter of the RND superfamily
VVGSAGSEVVFARLTVMIDPAALIAVDVPILTKTGLAAAGSVGIGVLVSLTPVPAMLGLFPNKELARKVPNPHSPTEHAWTIRSSTRAESDR